MFENFGEKLTDKLWDAYSDFRDLNYGYVPPEELKDEMSRDLYLLHMDMANASNGHVGSHYENDYLRPLVYADPAWIAYCIRQEIDDPNLDAAMHDEIVRVFSLSIPLALLIDHGWAIPTEDGIEDMKYSLEDIQEIKAIRREWQTVSVHTVMRAQWNRKHLRHCQGCEFDAHNEGALK